MEGNELTAAAPDRVSTGHEYFYPNRFGRIVLTSLEDVIGRHGVNAVLNLADLDIYVNDYPPNNLKSGFPFAAFGRIQETVDLMFGARGGRGLNIRAGRKSFKYVLNDFMPVLGIADVASRALPLGMKLKIGLNIFAESFNKLSDQVVHLGEDRQILLLEHHALSRLLGTAHRLQLLPLAVGLLEQALYWVSNKRSFIVEQELCHAAGDDYCQIVITKKPRGA